MMSDKPLLEVILAKAGKKLLNNPPSDDKHLISLLDQIESCLVTVEQCPPKSMLEALAPSIQALISHEIFGHSNTEVKVAVASCISELTRITAPAAPYDDDKMRDVFELIVSMFETLDDQSNQSYSKRVMILETVAQVRSCVMMLDLECDALLVKMFQHFLNAIRDDHPEYIFTFMVTIMSHVLEESERIPMELLYPLLDVVRRSNKGVLPMARKLGEAVLENSAAKIKPYLLHAVNNFGSSINLYSDVVTSICPEISFLGEEHDAHGTDDSEIRLEQTTLTETSSVETAQLQAEETAEKAGDANDKFVDLGTKKADDLYVVQGEDAEQKVVNSGADAAEMSDHAGTDDGNDAEKVVAHAGTDDAHEVGDAEQHVVHGDADIREDAEHKVVAHTDDGTDAGKKVFHASTADRKGAETQVVHTGADDRNNAAKQAVSAGSDDATVTEKEALKADADKTDDAEEKLVDTNSSKAPDAEFKGEDLMFYEGVIEQYDPGGRNCLPIAVCVAGDSGFVGTSSGLLRLQQEVVHDVRMKCVAVASKHPVYELGAAALVVRSSRCATQDSNWQIDVGLLTNINLRGC